jgi:hypothetical protein|tara:strand:- start:271 stop:513 length:243 start_codon:yes stop_codon:yes gene_type:complete
VDKKTKENWENFENWIPSDGYLNAGNRLDMGTSYEELAQGELFNPDEELREKYPALKKAWKQYLVIKKMCIAKEQEDENR